jgi:hypothetical protein
MKADRPVLAIDWWRWPQPRLQCQAKQRTTQRAVFFESCRPANRNNYHSTTALTTSPAPRQHGTHDPRTPNSPAILTITSAVVHRSRQVLHPLEQVQGRPQQATRRAQDRTRPTARPEDLRRRFVEVDQNVRSHTPTLRYETPVKRRRHKNE